MTDRLDQSKAIESALAGFAELPLADASRALFRTLGYQSDRTLRIATVKDFCRVLDAEPRLTERERDQLGRLSSLQFLFQLTDDELTCEPEMLNAGKVNDAQIFSCLFFAAELPAGRYTRTELAGIVRAINKPLHMPALVLFKHGDAVSIGIIHRRLHKRDLSKDVLEKVTLIKDIAFADPIRAHTEILTDFVLSNLDAEYGVSNFARLHEAWQKRLGAYALSNDFYREIADWYFWAHHQVEDGAIRLPQHCDTEQEKSLFLIRLLTRVIFCWFLVEKHLIPGDLFRERRLRALLKGYAPSRDPRKPDTAPTYYRAILQNLFFGTLNMPIPQRAFRERKKEGQRYDANYGITNLWRYEASFANPTDWLTLTRRIPFLNGGLFDCLDDKSGKKKDNFILDGFSDRDDFGCHLPNDLFFGPERVVDLSHDYGEEDKRSARSQKAKVRGLIEILSRYKFTIEENTPLEEEIALDPELLGKVFENLLASYNEDTRTTARKALGAFYTPREIVSYMVDEALKSYLSTQVPRCKAALEDLFSNKATLKEIKSDTRDALIAAIGRVKILDPACGSGAFPMGALHRLVDLLQKLDPNNESWKRDRLAEARRYRKLLEQTNAAPDELAACDARIADIEKSFDTRFHELDFARKLYLIENCIYGVDIQPIATQIAKLRFFISLVVDQKVDPKADNLGVRPLPNLETRLVAADTLIPLPKPQKHQGQLFDDANPDAYRRHNQLKNELTRIRHEHFNARDPRTKRKWRDEDQRVRSELRDLLEVTGLTARAAQSMADWDPYDQNDFARFFDAEWMFGIPVGKLRIQGRSPATLLGNLSLINEVDGQGELTPSVPREIDSGFDIVIGNPPYIRIQTLKQKNPDIVAFYKEYYASAAKGNYDIYVVFIEAGLHLLKTDGHLAYICPHKFFNSEYGEPLRALISRGKHLRHVVHFGDAQVFFGATIYTCLLFLAKAGADECRFIKAHDLDAWKSTLAGEAGRFATSDVGSADWIFAVGASASVFLRLQATPVKLGEVAARISQGIRTSANEIYVLDPLSEQRGIVIAYSKQLNSEVRLERKGLRLFLQGREIKPFSILASGKVVIIPYEIAGSRMMLLPFSKITKETPLLADYLKRNRGTLESREDGRMAGQQWHGFIYPKNLDVMLEPKLLVPDIADRACFALDEDGQYAFTSGYGITFKEPDKYPLTFMLGVCNSRVLDFYWQRVSTPLRGGYFRYFTQYLEQLPIAEAAPHQKNAVGRLAGVLVLLNRHFTANPGKQAPRDPPMLAYWERILNGLVYELYFPEEVHGAGLHLFDLVEKVRLPDVNEMPEAERLPRLRKLFETLHDGAHPLKIALDKLQTLDTVRIIEGKA